MKNSLLLVVLLCIAAAGVAEAGQFRIAPPSNQRKRQPPPNYRESRLQIVNDDDRGYAIDVDYRRNRLTLQHRSKGDIFVPANSRITLTFDDDDDWRIDGDNESLDIKILAGHTVTLRLETKMNKRQTGLFGTVEDGRKKYSKQLFRYADRPGRNDSNHRPGNAPTPPPPAPKPQPPKQPQPQPQKQPPKAPNSGPQTGGVLNYLFDNSKPGPRR